VDGARRPGDPDVLVASNRIAEALLGWEPSISIEESIASMWEIYK